MSDTVRTARPFAPALKQTALPPGIIGQVAGIALVYDVIDDHETTFARGCFAARHAAVKGGKIKLFWDHGDAIESGFYDSDHHIGTVRSLEDVQLPDGRWGVYMVADLFDTPKGREVKQYLQSVLATGGETGLSVGGPSRGVRKRPGRMDGRTVEQITEFPLREISITSMQSVPDSEVLAVRAHRSGKRLATMEERRAALRALPPVYATREERLMALRESYRVPTLARAR